MEKRRRAGADAAEIPVKQAEFELLNIERGTRGRNDAESPFYAEALERRTWDNGDEHLSKIERIVLPSTILCLSKVPPVTAVS